MNNPVRSLLQRRYEAPLFERLGGRKSGLDVIEIGCGRGIGTELILQRFGARSVFAFDFDPAMIERAAWRLERFPKSVVHLSVADAAAIPVADATFDAAFDFGAIHHVPDWRAAVAEIHRVLRPDGRFFFEEVTRSALDRWTYRTFLKHPTEDRFSGEEFIDQLNAQGLAVGDNRVYRVFNDFVIGVARRLAPCISER